MSEIEDDLRATAEAIISDAEKVKGIEQEKLDLPPGDARIPELADEAEEVAERILQEATVERELAARAGGGGGLALPKSPGRRSNAARPDAAAWSRHRGPRTARLPWPTSALPAFACWSQRVSMSACAFVGRTVMRASVVTRRL